MVTINGANPGRDIPQTIKVLGDGQVDVLRLLRLLDEEGYQGPIGLQCYALRGDMKENLSRAMKEWNRMCRERLP